MSKAGERISDALMALDVAGSFGQSLGRLQLQKFVYLADTLADLWEILPPGDGYETLYNGPYDSGVQNAVDVLAFRGCAEIVESTIRGARNIAANYQITESGKKILGSINALPRNARRYSLFKAIGIEINRRGWANIKALVYAEPNYVNQKSVGHGTKIDSTSLESSLTLQILTEFKGMANGSLTRQNALSLFFALLDNYQGSEAKEE